jgi:hypothetical protein
MVQPRGLLMGARAKVAAQLQEHFLHQIFRQRHAAGMTAAITNQRGVPRVEQLVDDSRRFQLSHRLARLSERTRRNGQQ